MDGKPWVLLGCGSKMFTLEGTEGVARVSAAMGMKGRAFEGTMLGGMMLRGPICHLGSCGGGGVAFDRLG